VRRTGSLFFNSSIACHRRDSVIPRMPDFRAPAPAADPPRRHQRRSFAGEVSVVINQRTRVAEHANRRNIIAVASQRFPAFSRLRQKKSPPKSLSCKNRRRLGSTFLRANPAWRPRIIWIPLPPSAFRLSLPLPFANHENRPASAIHPKSRLSTPTSARLRKANR